jgi:hypothetical protein
MIARRLKTLGGWLYERVAVATNDHDSFFGVTREQLRSAISEFFHLLEMIAVIGGFTAAGLWSENEVVRQIALVASFMLILYVRSWFPYSIVRNIDWKTASINTVYNCTWFVGIFYLATYLRKTVETFVYVALQIQPMP